METSTDPQGNAPASEPSESASLDCGKSGCNENGCPPIPWLRESMVEANHRLEELLTRVSALEKGQDVLKREQGSLGTRVFLVSVAEMAGYFSLALSVSMLARELHRHREEILYLAGAMSGLGVRR